MTNDPTNFMSYDEARERSLNKVIIVAHWLLNWGWASFESIQERLNLHRSGVYRLLATMEKEGYIVKDKGTLATRWRLTRNGRLLFSEDQPLREKRQVSWALARHDDQVQITVAKLLRRLGTPPLELEHYYGTNACATVYPSQGKTRRPDAVVFCAGRPLFIEYEYSKKGPQRRIEMLQALCNRNEEEDGYCWLLCDTPAMLATYRKSWLELQRHNEYEYSLHSVELGMLSDIDQLFIPGSTQKPAETFLTDERDIEIEQLKKEVDQLKDQLKQLDQKRKTQVRELEQEIKGALQYVRHWWQMYENLKDEVADALYVD